MQKLLEFNNIEFSYQHHMKDEPSDEILPQGFALEDQRTLKNVSFTLQRGELVVLLGANGSGKSTLARLANGLLLPHSGEVIAEGISSWHHDSILELRKLVGLVTQDPDNQIVSTTVFDEVAFGPQNLGWEPSRIYDSVSDALAQVGMPEAEFATRDPNSLSGGEKQRVVIAATLAMQPAFLILDEPTSMLDPQARAQVLEAITFAVKNGKGALHITHHLEEAVRADRVLVLDKGTLVYEGTPDGILYDEARLTKYGLMAKPVREGLHFDANRPETFLEGRNTLEFDAVTFAYPDNLEHKPVLKDMSFSLKAGECLLLIGASGSGKSTLLSLAAGLLQPDEGKVLLGNKPPVPGHIGLVFQQPETQLFAQTLQEDILFGPKNLGMSLGADGEDLVNEVLSAVGLDCAPFKNRSPFSLSGGEARRAAIATILALKTDFLLLDEPTAGLDARGRVFIYELLQSLLAQGKGIAIATHDPEFFTSLATGRMEL